MSLLPDLVLNYTLDEASGSRSPAFGSLVLSDNNTVGQAAGIIDTAALFVQGNSEYLNAADSAEINFENEIFCISVWVYGDVNWTTQGTQGLVTKWDNTATERTFQLKFESSTNRLQFITRGDGDVAGLTAQADTFGTPPDQTWFHVFAYYDDDNDVAGIQVNAGTRDTATGGLTGLNLSTADLKIGNHESLYFDGRLDELSIWRGRLLSQADVDKLYNSGVGLAYPFGEGAGPSAIAGSGDLRGGGESKLFIPPAILIP